MSKRKRRTHPPERGKTSRREFLGQVGGAAATLTVSAAGLSSLAGCDDKKDDKKKEHESLFQQWAARNESVVGASVYSHSGEFSPRVVDFALPGRGVSSQFVRKYRSSLSNEDGPLGRGWTFNYAKRIETTNDGVIYHDGLGRVHLFVIEKTTTGNAYVSPDGFYAALAEVDGKFQLRQRCGDLFVFDPPGSGGRLLQISDRNGNALKFDYRQAQSVRMTDSLGRLITIAYDRNRVVQLTDHTGHNWQYKYNDDRCLVEVIQPPTDEVPDGPRIRYEYGKGGRLKSITDPNGQSFLRNFYNDDNRVERQEHGTGIFKFEYERIGETSPKLPIFRTKVRQKNGARLFLEHDPMGHVVQRTMFVSSDSLSTEKSELGNQLPPTGNLMATVSPPGKVRRDEYQEALSEGRFPLVTKSAFNRHGELVDRLYPAGDTTQWLFDENNADPLARGNLLQTVRKPAPGIESDQVQLVTKYTYEPKYQRRQTLTGPRGYTVTFGYDDRGNLTRKTYPPVTITKIGSSQAGQLKTETKQLVENFAYNAGGQLIRVTDARGGITEYHYYPLGDPTGTADGTTTDGDPAQAGGYLARVVRDPAAASRALPGKPANLILELGYDAHGNITTVWDGKGNPTRFQYNPHGRLTTVTSREPFNYQTSIRYDANGNPIESTTSLDRNEYDSAENRVVCKHTTLRRRHEYNSLNGIVRRVTDVDGRKIVENFARDASENITRKVQPLGNLSEFRFDERNLLLERKLGVGTKHEVTIRYTYTPNGRRRSMTDGRGNTIRYSYDGFHRYRGFLNGGGTTKKQSLDEAGNVTRIEVTGDLGAMNEQGVPTAPKTVSLLETLYQYDELNRRVRIDRAWRDPATGQSLGKSQLLGQDGIVSTVVEYADNHRPSKIAYETGNVLSIEYNGANRVFAASDATGETASLQYDENGNPTRIERSGPEIEGDDQRFHQVIVQNFDELDHLVSRSINGEPPESFVYNALGLVTAYRNPAGVELTFLHDALGRFAGQAVRAFPPAFANLTHQLLLSQIEMNENDLVVGRTDAEGHRTRYEYDALNRRSAVIYPDGTAKHFQRDGNGNIFQIQDQNDNVIVHHFDVLNRLVERRVQPASQKDLLVEQFHYDGLNRIVAAVANGVTVLRSYDSLSHLLKETQDGRAILYGYDAAGNRTRFSYPGNEEFTKGYDVLKRVVGVADKGNRLITEYVYRSSGQLLSQKIGNLLAAGFAYKPCQGCLREIIYGKLDGSAIVDGYRYAFDVAGNRIQEAQLHLGDKFGERYVYDSANRLIAVRYGVSNLDDPSSSYRQEVLYELDPVGTWQHKTVKRPDGTISTRWDGVTNKRHAYVSLGSRRYEYDPNGNRIVELQGDGEECIRKLYKYDYANRLVEIQCLGSGNKTIQTLNYTYDAFGRQVQKRVTDAKGTHEYARVWSGRQFVQEWEHGNLLKSFVFGSRVSEPVKMTRFTANGRENFYYTLNGRDFVTSLVRDSGSVAERYRYDVFREPFLSEVDGSPVDEPVSSSKVGNPFYASGLTWDDNSNAYFALGSVSDPIANQYENPDGGAPSGGCGIDYPKGTNPTTYPADPRDAGSTTAGTPTVTVTQGSVPTTGWDLTGPGASLVVSEAEGFVGVVMVVEGALSVAAAISAGTGIGIPLGVLLGGLALIAAAVIGAAKDIKAATATKCAPGGSGGDKQTMQDQGGGTGDGSDPGTGGDPSGDPSGNGGAAPGGTPGDNGGEGGTPGGQDPGSGGEGESGGSGGCGGSDGAGDNGGEGGGAGSDGYTTGDGGPGGGAEGWGGGPGFGQGSASAGGFGFGNVGTSQTGSIGGGCGGAALSAAGVGGIGGRFGLGTSRGGCGGGIGGLGPTGMPGPDNPTSCGGGISRTGGAIIGGTNPTPIVGSPRFGGAIDPIPTDTMGRMGAPGGAGMFGIPGGGYTDPSPEDIGMSSGPRGSYSPLQPGQGYTDPSPELSGGSCGTGVGGGMPSPDCSRF